MNEVTEKRVEPTPPETRTRAGVRTVGPLEERSKKRVEPTLGGESSTQLAKRLAPTPALLRGCEERGRAP